MNLRIDHLSVLLVEVIDEDLTVEKRPEANLLSDVVKGALNSLVLFLHCPWVVDGAKAHGNGPPSGDAPASAWYVDSIVECLCCVHVTERHNQEGEGDSPVGAVGECGGGEVGELRADGCAKTGVRRKRHCR